MATAKLTSKCQITLPAAVREDLHVGPGDRIEFVKVEDDCYEIVAATHDVRNLKGMVKAKRPVSLEDMRAAIRRRGGCP